MLVREAMELAVSHYQAGRFNEAEQLYRTILAQQAENPFALNYLGLILNQRGQTAEALTMMRRSIAGNPPDAHLYGNVAGVLLTTGDFPGAEAAARAAITRDAKFPQAYLDLGHALWRQGRPDAAVTSYRQGIELAPERYDMHSALGGCLESMGRLDEAIAEFQRAVELAPERASNYGNLGTAQLAAHQMDEAIANCRRAVSAVPYEPMHHMNLALTLLTAGDWPAAWPEYEWRLQIPSLNPTPRIYIQPKWDGSPLDGRTILLYAEGGFSDPMTFARFVSVLAERGARVVLECRAELVKLFIGVKGVSQVVRQGDPLPQFDVHSSLQSIPLRVGTTVSNVPANVPYLSVPEAQISEASASIAQQAGNAKLRVGLSWNETGAAQGRSPRLQMLAPLADVESVRWYNLGPTSGNVTTLHGAELVDLNPTFRDFTDVAAAIANLDLVISADTLVAHLAGALGKDVWLMTPYSADWRWLLDREDSPWYPTMRLFRQPKPGDWATVAARISDSLRQRAAGA